MHFNSRFHKAIDKTYKKIDTDKFEQISFVNGISTFKGGKHVDCVVKMVTNK